MDLTVGIMLLIAGGLTVAAYLKAPQFAWDGMRAGGKMLWDVLPSLLLGFVAAGMITVVLPRELMGRLLGDESGLGGLVIATVAGALTPGGPFVQFPIVAALLKAGAGVGPMTAYVSAWGLIGVNRFLVYEVPMLGWKLALCRILGSAVFPVLIGALTRVLWSGLKGRL